MNLVVLSGHLSSEPTVRELPSGSVLMTFELTTPVEDGGPSKSKPTKSKPSKSKMVSVPLVWFDPPNKVTVGIGDEISAVGTVRRRFYRAGAATQSRTEVVVQHLGRLTDKKALAKQQRWIAGVMGADGVNGLRST